MATLRMRFPGGRYHATPFGHHVNEGLVEWPPSPWRILRALIASGYTTQRWREIPPSASRLLEALAGRLPRYRLPTASLAHSRHYMPTGMLAKGRERTTLVFDTWADVAHGALSVHWQCVLDDEAHAMLRLLAAGLGYLGRSESWVVAEVVADDDHAIHEFDAVPHEDLRRGGDGWEQVSLLAAESPAAYRDWRARKVSDALAELPLPDGRKRPSKSLLKARAAAEAPYPADIIECLQRDTTWWKQHRWGQPPGTHRALYWRRSDALSVGAPVRPRRSRTRSVTTALLALTVSGGSSAALPMISRTLPQAELLHRALLARAARGNRIDCPELTGKDAAGNPLAGHRHAHLLPVDLDGDGRIDHILIHAPMGLGATAQAAIRGLERTWTKGGVGELMVALAGQGDLDHLRRLPAPIEGGILALLGPAGGARMWTSTTPFVAPRYVKRRGANALLGQVAAELASRGLPPASVEVLPWDDTTMRLRHAVRRRRHPARQPPADAGFALKLEFSEPVTGPVTLGYASHFGLGMFRAD